MKKRFLISFSVLFFLIILLVAWNLSTGSASISLPKILQILSGDNSDLKNFRVIWSIRLPRLLSALVLGGALSLSGFLLQSFFQNPIAGPYVLGISSGAKLFVAITMIFFMEKGIALGSAGMVLSAFVGSVFALAVVLLFSARVKKMSVLIVIGIFIGYICSAVTDFLVTFANDSNIVNLHNWSVGSFSGSSWTDVKIMSAVVFPSALVSFMLSKSVSAFSLGENYARNMGVNVKALRFTLIFLSSVLSACVTAFAGPISFVGIAVPHLVRAVFRTAKPLVLIPACFLGGSAVTLLCDGIARTLFAPTEVSISSVTSVFLVPVVIYMMMRRRKDYE
ncbi:MAG: iron ABC transporter permease [Treponema sp.]|nr:iron ABC transporter permease [Treponema sp.]